MSVLFHSDGLLLVGMDKCIGAGENFRFQNIQLANIIFIHIFLEVLQGIIREETFSTFALTTSPLWTGNEPTFDATFKSHICWNVHIFYSNFVIYMESYIKK